MFEKNTIKSIYLYSVNFLKTKDLTKSHNIGRNSIQNPGISELLMQKSGTSVNSQYFQMEPNIMKTDRLRTQKYI